MERIINTTEYDDIVSKMKLCVNEYNNKYSKNIYSLNLANGNLLDIRIPESRIAHLLGLNDELLRRIGLIKYKESSFTALNHFLEKITYYSIAGKVNNKEINTLFSKNIYEKLEAFEYNIDIKPWEIMCIIKYDSKRTYQMIDKADICDYYIIRKNNDKYYALGLIKEEVKFGGKFYVPVTNRMYDNEEEFDNFMSRIANNQEITYAFKTSVYNYPKSYNNDSKLTLNDKYQALSKVESIATKYNGITSCSKDYLTIITNTINANQRFINNMAILKLLSTAIKNNDVVEQDDIYELIGNYSKMDENIQNILDTWNDKICENFFESKSASESYSNLQNENNSLKQELELKKQELLECKRKIVKYEQELIKKMVSATETNDKMDILDKKLKVLLKAFDDISNM